MLCDNEAIYSAIRLGLFTFLIHAVCFDPWWARLKLHPLWGDLLCFPPAIAAACLSLRSGCSGGEPVGLLDLGVFATPLAGLFVLSTVMDNRGFPHGFRGSTGMFFAGWFMIPFLGAVYSLGWLLLSKGLPTLLFLPPEKDPGKRSLRESIIGWGFRILRWLLMAGVALLFIVALVS